MSIYDVSKRFEKEILLAADNLLISFPMFTKNDEMIFFYQTKKIDGRNIIIEYIDKVVYRNRQNGEIISKNFTDLIHKGVNLDINIPFETMPKDNDFSIEDEFYSLHERILFFVFSKKLDEKQKSLLSSYVDNFYNLVPDGSLRNVYKLIGHDFFDYVDQMNGLDICKSK